jgi:hypothetical protein
MLTSIVMAATEIRRPSRQFMPTFVDSVDDRSGIWKELMDASVQGKGADKTSWTP